MLAQPQQLAAIIDACFAETTTLGVRWQIVERTSLARSSAAVDAGGQRLRVKQATRPDGTITRKAEMDDLARSGGSRAGREALRRLAETAPSHDVTADD